MKNNEIIEKLNQKVLVAKNLKITAKERSQSLRKSNLQEDSEVYDEDVKNIEIYLKELTDAINLVKKYEGIDYKFYDSKNLYSGAMCSTGGVGSIISAKFNYIYYYAFGKDFEECYLYVANIFEVVKGNEYFN